MCGYIQDVPRSVYPVTFRTRVYRECVMDRDIGTPQSMNVKVSSNEFHDLFEAYYLLSWVHWSILLVGVAIYIYVYIQIAHWIV